MKIILASSSSTRQDMLKKMGINFEVQKPNCEEIVENSASMEEEVKRFAKQKALSVYEKYEQEKDVLILAFDSLVEVENEILEQVPKYQNICLIVK